MLSLYKLEHFLGIKMKDLFWKSVCLYLSVSMSVYLPYSGKVWKINKSTSRLLTASTNLDGF